MVEIPRVETERLILRGFRDSDLEAYAAMVADGEVMRFMGGPRRRERAWYDMAWALGHWDLRGYGLWAAEEKASGRLLGRLGLINPEGWPGLEVGWLLGRDSWGRGFATEGGRAALAFAFERVGVERVISLIHPDNRASIRVAERLGESYCGATTLDGVDALVYAIERGVFEK